MDCALGRLEVPAVVNTTLSGWILDPDHKNVEVKGNVNHCRTSRSAIQRRREGVTGPQPHV